MQQDEDEDRASVLKRLGLTDFSDPEQAEEFVAVSRRDAQASVQRMLHSETYKKMAAAYR